MKTYDVKCPICAHVNHDLFLEETEGWMECEKCGQVTKPVLSYKTIKIPVYSMKNYDRQAIVSG